MKSKIYELLLPSGNRVRKQIILSILLVIFGIQLQAQFTLTPYNVTCNGACNGTAAVNPHPANYHYLWSNTDTAYVTTNLCAGNYNCVVFDSVFNPLDTLYVTITEPAPIFITPNIIDATCFGVPNGVIALTVSGGTPAYTYVWATGMVGPVGQGLWGGNSYGVTVTDANGCTVTGNYFVNQPQPISLLYNKADASNCNACDGWAALTVYTGGVSPFTFSWSNGATTPTITNLCPGAYSGTVTDGTGCVAYAPTVYIQATNTGLVINAVNTGIHCNGIDTTVLSVTGGIAPYFITWGDGSSATGNSPLTHHYATGGTYYLNISDSTGCGIIIYDTIINYGVSVSAGQVIYPSCNGNPTGKIKLNVTGGSPQYTFLWSNGAVADSIVNVVPGTYSVTVTDQASCSALFVLDLFEQSFNTGYYAYAYAAVPPNCGNNGAAGVLVFGGNPQYTYVWNTVPAQTTPIATGLSAGIYHVTVTDSTGCPRTASIALSGTCMSIITGTVFNDTNNNCLFDAGETIITNVTVQATQNGQNYYGYTNASGQYSISVPFAGTYNLTASLSYWATCGNVSLCGNANQTVTLTGTGDTLLNNNFGFVGSTGFDLALHPGWSSANPGFQKEIWILYHNLSPTPFTGSATVKLVYDSNLIYQSGIAPLPVHNATTHTLTWVVNNVPSPSFNWSDRLRSFFLVPANLSLSYQLQNNFYIEPTSGDCDSLNNHQYYAEEVTGSHDPNEKEVSPAGDIYDQDSVLTYTIHFQNTGTDTTWFIIIKDTLSTNLDPLSVKNLASSHPYSSFNISGQGILTWVFNPVYLVDSNTNEPASKGFVTFSIKRKSNLPIGTTIRNKAYIYFDYNEPVVTNSAANTIADPNYVFEVLGSGKVAVAAFPNPFSQSTRIVITGLDEKFDFTLFDLTGRTKRNIASLETNNFEIKRDDLSAGVYFFKISTGSQQVAYGKLVVE